MRSAVHRLLLEALCAGVLVLSAAGTNAPTTAATTTDSPSSAPTSTGSPTTGSPTTLPPIRGPTGSPTGGPTSHPTIDKCSLAKTDSGIDDGRFNWPTLNAPYESLATVLIALAFLPAVGVASIYGAPRRVRVLWAWLTGGRGPEVEPILPEEEMSFWSLAGSDMSIRRKEARRSWSENWFRGARDRQRLSNDLGEPLLDLKPDEEWEEAPEFVPDDDYSVVFTHALRPGTVYEPDSACWQPSPELLESGIEIEEATPLNCLERLFSCRAGSMLDQYVGWLLPHLDTAVAQRRSNLYRPLYYKAKDVRWCPGAIHKTYRNVLSKPDFQEKASEQSIKTSHERALLSYLPELRALEQLYSVAFYFSVILFVLMLPLIFDGMTDNSTDVYFKDQGIQDRVKFQTYVLWRTSWINADDPDGHSWRDGWIRFVLTMRMLMLAAVLLWACFRHSAHDVMIDHPIGMDDFTVELRDLPLDVTEDEILDAFAAEDPELSVAKVLFIESSFPDPDDEEEDEEEKVADDRLSHCVALVCFHTVAMHDQATKRPWAALSQFGARSWLTALEMRDGHKCRVMPAGPPCEFCSPWPIENCWLGELLYKCYAWSRAEHLNSWAQYGLLALVVLILISSYLILYGLYCNEFGVNPFNPKRFSGEQVNNADNEQVSTLSTSYSFQASMTAGELSLMWSGQALALVVALAMPPILEKVIGHFNTRTRYSYVVSRCIVWSTIVGMFYLPAQVMAASATIFAGFCASDELALATVTGVAFYMYCVIFPFIILVKPPLLRLLTLWLKQKFSSNGTTQKDLDDAYQLPPFDSIEHYYDLIYLTGVARIIMGFTGLSMLSSMLTLYLTQRAMHYHLRFQASAPKYACGSPAQHVTAVFMFLLVNVLVTIKHGGLFTDGSKTQVLIGATPSTLFQGTKNALEFWPMLTWGQGNFLLVISIPEVLLLLLARYSYGWVYFLALKKDLPRRRLKTVGATYTEFSTRCENYDKANYTSARKDFTSTHREFKRNSRQSSKGTSPTSTKKSGDVEAGERETEFQFHDFPPSGSDTPVSANKMSQSAPVAFLRERKYFPADPAPVPEGTRGEESVSQSVPGENPIDLKTESVTI